jgi:hypothetical protein
MKKKLTRDSFSALRETAIVLDEDYQRRIQGGCTSDDHGIGYTDSAGNYHWTRTSECNSNCSPSGSYGSSSDYGSSGGYGSSSDYYNGSYYGSSSSYYGSSYSGSSYSGSSSAYGTFGNPVIQSDYWKLSSADRWYGGYVEGLGYVAGDAIVTGSYYGSSSSYNYGSSGYDYGSSGYGSSSSFNYWDYLYGSGDYVSSSGYNGFSGWSTGGDSYDGNPGIFTVTDPNSLISNSKDYLKGQIDNLKNIEPKPESLEDYIKTLEKVQYLLENTLKNNEYDIRFELFIDDKDAGLEYDANKKEIVIGINENLDQWDRIKMLSHELTHLDQLKKGELWIEDGKMKGYDIQDEVAAFQMQHDVHYGRDAKNFDLAGNPVESGDYKVTAEDVKNLSPDIYGNLSDDPISKPKQ